jgi:uncharacterized repeat protein (TIGR01451 family)
MFEKLLAVLPYNPGLSHQLAFYSRRMHEEASIRRTGMILMVLTFFIQFFAVLVPPQPTVASSTNDVINGGFSSREEANDHCHRDTQGFQRLLHYYGISCSKIESASVHEINSGGNNYYSIGRQTSPAADTPVSIPGTGTFYWRDMNAAWGNFSFKALQLQNQDGKTYYIMYDCANLVTVGIPPHSQLTTTVGEVTGGGGGLPPQPVTPTPIPTTVPIPAEDVPEEDVPEDVEEIAPEMCPYNNALALESPLCYQACPYNPLLPIGDIKCKPCEESISSTDAAACISVHKAASNITTGLVDANNSTAKAGDLITYTLFAENKGKATVEDFKFFENISDVLDYATVTDLHGGTMSSDNNVSWPAQDIEAGETATVKITVKVKDPIPQTPVSTTDPYHFDLVMTNVYGNTVSIKLPGSPAKAVEVAATKLPNTGPGESLAVMAAIVIFAGYFYGRARLLSEESAIALTENAGA